MDLDSSLHLSPESVVPQSAGFDRLATSALNGPAVTKAAASDSDLRPTSHVGESRSLPGVDNLPQFRYAHRSRLQCDAKAGQDGPTRLPVSASRGSRHFPSEVNCLH
jgi:hypothetical protein